MFEGDGEDKVLPMNVAEMIANKFKVVDYSLEHLFKALDDVGHTEASGSMNGWEYTLKRVVKDIN